MRSTKVLVADANSTDGTPDIVMGFRDRLNVTVIRGGMPSVGRNQGASGFTSFLGGGYYRHYVIVYDV